MHLGAAVTSLKWSRAAVLVGATFAGERFTARAKRAIVTLPLGVLQDGPLRLPQKREALRKLASGPVIRVAMRFHEQFWAKRAPGVAFFHSPAAPFPSIRLPRSSAGRAGS